MHICTKLLSTQRVRYVQEIDVNIDDSTVSSILNASNSYSSATAILLHEGKYGISVKIACKACWGDVQIYFISYLFSDEIFCISVERKAGSNLGYMERWFGRYLSAFIPECHSRGIFHTGSLYARGDG